MKHTIVVSNIGIVYEGDSGMEATHVFDVYSKRVNGESGRLMGETVTWMQDDVMHYEVIGSFTTVYPL